MSDYEVTCIRPDGADVDRRIDRLGGPILGNAAIDDVIRWIDEGHRFWTSVDGRSVWIETKVHPVSGRRFLQTVGDNYPNNNLLRLPRCPT